MNDCSELLRQQRDTFESDRTKALAFRLQALRRLHESIRRHERDVMAALKADVNKSEFEAYASEIGFVLHDISFTIKRLRRWVRPQRVPTPLTHIGSRSEIHPEPYGVTLILAPWNYPFQLAIAPLVGAVAAGNCAIVKPSELTPRTSEIIAAIVRDVFDPGHATVVQGGPETSQALLAEKFDYIFFTGGAAIGRVVMEAAARHLTPVTLELGGKSPVIVEPDAKLRLAAKRIVWGKFLNAGQTCVAPDTLFVHESVVDAFAGYVREAIAELYGPDPLANEQLTRIVSRKHYDRLLRLMDSGTVLIGGRGDPERLAIEPTVLTEVAPDAPIMQEEIFGPLLPIVPYSSLDEVIEYIRQREKPLALYVFSENKAVQREVLLRLSFGGGCVNDVAMQFTTPYLPFGGVGASGMGAYHGKYSFDTFSHRKSVLRQPTWFDIPARYPHVSYGLRLLRKLMK